MTGAVRAALSTVNDAIVTCMRAVSECINTSKATEEGHRCVGRGGSKKLKREVVVGTTGVAPVALRYVQAA